MAKYNKRERHDETVRVSYMLDIPIICFTWSGNSVGHF